MLSVDFSTPLAGPARSARIKQMSNNHPAFEKSRMTQEILVKIQHSLRRMPGVSASESNEIIAQLQEVGQIISQETSQLVDALMNLNLDQEDTDRSIARMAIEANLAKATNEDQLQAIKDLRDEVKAEKSKAEQAESEMKKMMEDLEDLTVDFKKLKNNAEKQQSGDASSSDEDEDIVKSLESTIQNLEEQVNKHRTLWVMRRSNPEVVARAIENAAESAQDSNNNNNSYNKSMMPMKPASGMMPIKNEEGASDDTAPPRILGDIPPPARAASAFQPMHRPPTTGPPPKFGQLQTGPPRPPSTMPHDRRVSGGWNSDRSDRGGGGRSGSFGGNAQPPSYAQSSFRAPSRKGFQNSNSRYRNDYQQHQQHQQQQSNFAMPENPPHRPNSSFGYGRDYYPNTPTAQGRGRYGRSQDIGGGQNPPPPPWTTPPAPLGRSGYVGPTILITERMAATWHEQIMDFYAVIRTFVERHANNPDNVRNVKTNAPALWPILLATYHPLSESEATSYLEYHLRNENSKSCLVTRVVIDFIVNRVWVPGAWSGADPDSTYALMELEQDFERTQGQPSVLRQPLLDRQSTIIDTIIKTSSHTPFIKHKIEETTSALLSNLQPFLNKFSAPNPADTYRDMEAVVDNAWELSCRILTSRLTFDFRFPEIGSRFSSQSMLPIWPPMDPLELQAKHWRVALVTTPVVTCRNDTGSNISAHSVSLADVFCMQ
ncbi:hypothetical protein PT974_02504 [Cladobotryum mycophilum]|uniref:Uncharacterized protein n=1 Tax=Cladobotryum mycophilum TaxID=491253 RepID=A0ABR0SYA0_9HYPO